jgi:sec-independent protein translocase protein TatA
MPGIGPLEIVVVLVIALLVFGPKRLPEMGRSVGKGLREFKDSVTGDKEDDDDDHVKIAAVVAPPVSVPVSAPREAVRDRS